MKELTENEIQLIVHEWLRDVLELCESGRAHHAAYTPELQAEELADMERYEASYRRALGRRDYSAVAHVAENLAVEQGIIAPRSSPLFGRLQRELVKAGVRHAQIEQEKTKGTYDGDLPAVDIGNPTRAYGSNGASSSAAVDRNEADQLSVEQVSSVYAAFERDMMKGRRWMEKTRLENGSMVQTMTEIIGDIPLASIDKPSVRKFKDKLQNYPRNRHKDPRYRGKTLAQIESMATVDTISVTTVNNHLTKLAGFFGWAVDKGYIATNPFVRMTTPTSDRVKESVLPFDQADLALIFGAPLYREDVHRKPWQFWLPLLGLTTGARIEELCQLHVEDVREVEGILCLDINDKAGRTLKTKSSRRIIPVHPELLRIGFKVFVEQAARGRNARLFPPLSPVKGKHSHYASIWFGKLKRSLGMPERKKVFHSFRHLMADKLRRVQAPDYLIKRFLGHEVGSTTHDVYGSDAALVPPLLDVLKRIEFGVDLSHVMWTKA